MIEQCESCRHNDGACSLGEAFECEHFEEIEENECEY